MSFAASFKSVNAAYCMCKRIGTLATQPHHMLILEFNMRCKLCEGTITMMDDFINQVRHEETCSTCTSEKAITAKIIRRCMQMSALSFLTISPKAVSLLLFKIVRLAHCYSVSRLSSEVQVDFGLDFKNNSLWFSLSIVTAEPPFAPYQVCVFNIKLGVIKESGQARRELGRSVEEPEAWLSFLICSTYGMLLCPWNLCQWLGSEEFSHCCCTPKSSLQCIFSGSVLPGLQ